MGNVPNGEFAQLNRRHTGWVCSRDCAAARTWCSTPAVIMSIVVFVGFLLPSIRRLRAIKTP